MIHSVFPLTSSWLLVVVLAQLELEPEVVQVVIALQSEHLVVAGLLNPR
jgi:hypothetical protein